MSISAVIVRARILAASALVVASASSAALAEGKSRMFTIPADEGYGVAECFSPGSTCGQVVADAYCEANGWGAALAYGRAEDITAAIAATPASTAPAPAKGALVVNCSE